MKRKRTDIILAIGVLCMLTIAFVYHFAKASYTSKNNNDPNWANTHVSFESAEKAANELGNDLYICEFTIFIQENVTDKCVFSYELEFEENGGLENRNTWTMFSMEVISASENWMLYVFFNSNDTRLEELTSHLTYKMSINNTTAYYYPNDKSSAFEAITFKKAEKTVYISCNYRNPISELDHEVLSFTASLFGG